MTKTRPYNIFIVDYIQPEQAPTAKIKLSRRMTTYPSYLEPGEVVIVENNDKRTYYSIFSINYDLHRTTIQ